MSGARSFLATTALALILAAPTGLLAQDAGKEPAKPEALKQEEGKQESGKYAAVPTGTPAARPIGEARTETPSVTPAEGAGKEPVPTATNGSEPEQQVDRLASLDPADRVIAEQIRDMLAAKGDRIFASKNERAAVEAFYQARNLAPIWLDKGIVNARATAAIARIRGAEADGLDLSDYRVPDLSASSPDALAEADLKLTQVVLTFARHLQAGRFPYTRVSQHNIALPQVAPEPADILAKLVNAADAAKALDEFSPPQEEYQRLRAKLAELRGNTRASRTEIADGPVLKFNPKTPVEDARVPLLRERLGLSSDASDLKYDAKLAEAVKKFQATRDLPPTGSLDARTVKELNGPGHSRDIDLVIANMERWRWYARDLGAAHVIVNQPDFMMHVVRDGKRLWTTKIVIGEPKKPTPLLSETMKSITINPTWNVPPSITYGEYLPALQRDPTILSRMGLNVTYLPGGGIHVSQPPSAINVLGRIRFNFPNKYIVYQHDTNEKFMFAHDVRAYSHGCMRVQDPSRYAEILLNIARPNEHWTVDRVQRLYGAGEQDIQVAQANIWVHVTYQSAFVDDAGKLQTRRDIYGTDSRTMAAIRSERAIIENAPPPAERKKEPEVASSSSSSSRQRTAASAPQTPNSFFAALFGRPMPPPGRVVRPSRGLYYR
ncbi:MAG: L,D-transpeptidase family protein [Xanthobacteraceae bacterium]|jgi:L,D-transpeptidase YcbB